MVTAAEISSHLPVDFVSNRRTRSEHNRSGTRVPYWRNTDVVSFRQQSRNLRIASSLALPSHLRPTELALKVCVRQLHRLASTQERTRLLRSSQLRAARARVVAGGHLSLRQLCIHGMSLGSNAPLPPCSEELRRNTQQRPVDAPRLWIAPRWPAQSASRCRAACASLHVCRVWCRPCRFQHSGPPARQPHVAPPAGIPRYAERETQWDTPAAPPALLYRSLYSCPSPSRPHDKSHLCQPNPQPPSYLRLYSFPHLLIPDNSSARFNLG